MTKITLSTEATYLTLDGHAGAGPKGRDIVCAALSALAFTLARVAQKNTAYGTRFDANWEEATMVLRCEPEDEAMRERCRQLFAAFGEGFHLIAEAYPEYVSFQENAPMAFSRNEGDAACRAHSLAGDARTLAG